MEGNAESRVTQLDADKDALLEDGCVDAGREGDTTSSAVYSGTSWPMRSAVSSSSCADESRGGASSAATLRNGARIRSSMAAMSSCTRVSGLRRESRNDETYLVDVFPKRNELDIPPLVGVITVVSVLPPLRRRAEHPEPILIDPRIGIEGIRIVDEERSGSDIGRTEHEQASKRSLELVGTNECRERQGGDNKGLFDWMGHWFGLAAAELKKELEAEGKEDTDDSEAERDELSSGD
jgi:hypothetical protein